MKPEYEKIQPADKSSFIVKKVIRNSRPLLTQAWHYHPEIELCYTTESTGKRYVGNNISEYNEGDMVFLGSNLPHGFTTSIKTEQYVIQFTKAFMGQEFFNKTELYEIRLLLSKAMLGISVEGQTKVRVANLVKEIYSTEGIDRLIGLLKMLKELANSNELKAICSEQYSNSINVGHLGRVKTVLDYIENHYQSDISIDTISKQINLTESAFYKFIKRHTGKKFTTIVNEFRIDHATNLLTNTDKSIAEVCYESGFNNLSYFNRKFKQLKLTQPNEYRNNLKLLYENTN